MTKSITEMGNRIRQSFSDRKLQPGAHAVAEALRAEMAKYASQHNPGK